MTAISQITMRYFREEPRRAMVRGALSILRTIDSHSSLDVCVDEGLVADAASLRGDWHVVGDDLRTVIERSKPKR